MKKLLSPFLIAISSVAILGACSGEESSDSNSTLKIKLAHSGSETHQYHIASEEFKKLVEEKSNGDITIEIHPNSTLGSEAEVIEQVIDGTIDMTTVAADSSLANTIEEMNIFGIPYLFEDAEHVYSNLDGALGDILLEKVNENNMHGLGYWEVGFRHITTNNKPVNLPEDLKGLKIRVQPATVWESHMKALGANPTPVNFNELYSALDQGVVDGQENPLSSIYSMKFYEVQNSVALTAHTYTPAVVLMSGNAWTKLNEEQQAILEEATQEAAEYQREYLAQQDKKIITELEAAGVTFTEPDRAAFKEATKDVKSSVSTQVPSELINKITSK